MIKTFTTKINKFRSNLNLTRILKLIWSVAKGWTTISLSLILLESLLFFFSLYMLRLIINTLSSHGTNTVQNEHTIIKYVVLAALVSVLYIVVKSLSSYVTEVQSGRVAEFIDDKIHENANHLDLSFYESPEYFDILKRAKDTSADRPNLIVTTLVEIARNSVSLVAIASVLVSIDWRLFPLLGLFVIPTLWVRINFADNLNRLRISQTKLERKSTYLSTLLTSDIHAKEIRSFGLGDYLRKIYLSIRLELLSGKLRISRKRTSIEIVTTSIASIGLFSCIGYIALGSIRGYTSIGDITLFLVAFPQSFGIMQNIASGISTVYQNSIFVKSIFELIDLRSGLKESVNPLPIPDTQIIDLELKHVSFTYPNADQPTLSDINITLPAGKIIALVGMNGAGKSTLIKLLCRLYDPTSGQITLNDTDIREFSSTDYQKQICAVFQDFGKYNVSVADNIKFGNISGDHKIDEIMQAAKNSGADSFINTFPDKYETIMGRIFEDGHEVSIGQWQKLAIARAFYSPSQFLILDEATSALDAMSEKELFESLRQRIGNRAALIISHRQSAVKHADFIYVLSKGRISESGTHDELVQLGGEYYTLFSKTTADQHE